MKNTIIVAFTLGSVMCTDLNYDDMHFGPSNTAADLATSVMMKCNASLGYAHYQWYYGVGMERTKIFDGLNKFLDPELYHLRTSNRHQYDLVIWDAWLGMSGPYTCSKTNGSVIVDSTAYMVLLEERPKCTHNAINQPVDYGALIRYACSVKYSGQWAPVMRWDHTPANVRNETEPNRDSDNPALASYSFTLRATRNNSVYRCVTSFDHPKIEEGRLVHECIPGRRCVARQNVIAYREDCVTTAVRIKPMPTTTTSTPTTTTTTMTTASTTTTTRAPTTTSSTTRESMTTTVNTSTSTPTTTTTTSAPRLLVLRGSTVDAGVNPGPQMIGDTRKSATTAIIVLSCLLFVAIAAGMIGTYMAYRKIRNREPIDSLDMEDEDATLPAATYQS